MFGKFGFGQDSVKTFPKFVQSSGIFGKFEVRFLSEEICLGSSKFKNFGFNPTLIFQAIQKNL